mgnify:CR=1 FL=1
MLSRVADSLYWMARYLERAEHTARLMEVTMNLALDASAQEGPVSWAGLLKALDTPAPDKGDDFTKVASAVCFDRNNVNSITACIFSARENARQIREQISSEMFEQLNRLYLRVQRINPGEFWADQPHEFFHFIKQGSHLFQGITDSTLNHGEDWNFIQLGRAIERANNTSALLDAYFGEPVVNAEDNEAPSYLKWVGLLKSCTAFEAYVKHYRGGVRPERIAEFLLLDSDFPRSVRHCTDELQASLLDIGRDTSTRRAVEVERLAGKLHAALAFTPIEEVIHAGLHPFLEEVQDRCAAIHDGIYRVYIGYTVEDLSI